MKMILKINIMSFLLILMIISGGCQALFTTSPFQDALKPDASELPPDQLSTYCWDVLAEGTAAEKAAVYAAIQAALEGDSADDPDLNYAAGTLALDQAGFSIDTIMSGMDDPTIMEDFFAEENMDNLEDAGDYFLAADTAGAELTATDQIFGGIGLLLATVPTVDDLLTIDFNNLTTEQEIATEMLAEGVTAFAALVDPGASMDPADLLSILIPAP
jgi:hypothetical protein